MRCYCPENSISRSFISPIFLCIFCNVSKSIRSKDKRHACFFGGVAVPFGISDINWCFQAISFHQKADIFTFVLSGISETLDIFYVRLQLCLS